MKILDYLYPKRCPICHDIVMPKGKRICNQCKNSILVIEEPKCLKCGKPLQKMEQEYCYDCQKKKHFYEQGISVFVYDKKMQKSIAWWKYNGRREYGDFFGEIMAAYGRKKIKRWKIDLMIPVPVHKKRYRQRGFNQAEQLASMLSIKWNVPMNRELVVRSENTKAQKKLGNTQRHKNVEHAFELKCQGKIKQERILIIDDIYTTGSTVDAIASLLKEHGVKEVFFFSLSIGRGL